LAIMHFFSFIRGAGTDSRVFMVAYGDKQVIVLVVCRMSEMNIIVHQPLLQCWKAVAACLLASCVWVELHGSRRHLAKSSWRMVQKTSNVGGRMSLRQTWMTLAMSTG
jgi:hypothetical protein